MGQLDYRQAFRNVSVCLLIILLTHHEPALAISGFGTLIALLVIAGLLMFAASRSPDICIAAIAFIQSLPTFLFPLVSERVSIQQLPTAVLMPAPPSLSPRFQRPPPLFSL